MRGLLSRRVDKRQRGSAMLSIDQEIGIQRQHGMPIMDFRHATLSAPFWISSKTASCAFG
jgi:hypothetical protein